jgi:hypothetical protein
MLLVGIKTISRRHDKKRRKIGNFLKSTKARAKK